MRNAPVVLLVVGLLQMAGDVLRLSWLKGLGAATAASPAPKVFTSIRGLEAFSSRFFLEWEDRSGLRNSLELTPEVYERLRGPYPRRNVFGAVLAAGPALVTDDDLKPLFDGVGRYALCGEAPVLRELGVDPAAVSGTVRVRYEPRPGSKDQGMPRLIAAPCAGPSTPVHSRPDPSGP